VFRSRLRLLSEQQGPDYRAGYKAGWSHAHRNPGQPARPDPSRGQDFVRGYNAGHQVSGHAQSVLGSILKMHDAVHQGDGDAGREHADRAQERARSHILEPHYGAMSKATEARRKAGLADDSRFRSAVQNWAGHVGKRLPHGVRRPVMAGHVAALTQMANGGEFHPADFHERLVHAVGAHSRSQG
jgi:hypothetical protein